MKQLLPYLLLILPFYAQAQKPCPCCTAEHRAFDFWAGDWETFDTSGTLVGTNDIRLLQDSCILQENWASAKGKYTGTSYNFYNKQTKKWEQLWIDNQGANLKLSGERIGNQMILWSEELLNQKGKPYQHRITWTAKANGSVRQHWEVTSDKGKTFKTLFDGLYKKKK